ncbi:hypothetical protein QMW_0871 [Clostridioides difficile DA00313]|nr:hypothetical protein QMW_0871 [Clostridioides difficile DA00313]
MIHSPSSAILKKISTAETAKAASPTFISKIMIKAIITTMLIREIICFILNFSICLLSITFIGFLSLYPLKIINNTIENTIVERVDRLR